MYIGKYTVRPMDPRGFWYNFGILSDVNNGGKSVRLDHLKTNR